MDPRGEENTVSRTSEIEAFSKIFDTSEAYSGLDRRRENEVNVFEDKPMKNPTPNSTSVLEQNYMSLQDNIDRLFNQVENLEQRLKIILTDSELESVKDSMGYGGNTTLSENLAQLCRRTQDLSDRLSYLTARIDL